MELLGHSQLSETLKRCTKVREGLKRQALDRLDALQRPPGLDRGDNHADHQLLSYQLSIGAWLGLQEDELNSKS